MDVKYLHADGEKDAGSLLSATNRSTVNPVACRLTKAEILRGYQSFSSVITRGTYVSSRYLSCYFDFTDAIPPGACQVGFAVRRAGMAVTRNWWKRRLREGYRLQKSILTEALVSGNLSMRMVLLVNRKKTTGGETFNDICTCLASILLSLRERIPVE